MHGCIYYSRVPNKRPGSNTLLRAEWTFLKIFFKFPSHFCLSLTEKLVFVGGCMISLKRNGERNGQRNRKERKKRNRKERKRNEEGTKTSLAKKNKVGTGSSKIRNGSLLAIRVENSSKIQH